MPAPGLSISAVPETPEGPNVRPKPSLISQKPAVTEGPTAHVSLRAPLQG